MPATTPNYSLPYPLGPDAAVIAGDIQSLASAVDTNLVSFSNDLDALDSSLTNQVDSVRIDSRHVTGSTTAVNGDFLICDSPTQMTVTLPAAPTEDTVIRIFKYGLGIVDLSASNTINGVTSLINQNSGILATFTSGSWWCLPLALSGTGGGDGGYTPPDVWVRPAEWLAQPVVNSSSDFSYYLLQLAVNESVEIELDIYTNLPVAGQEYHINWGDGTSENVVPTVSTTVLYHTFLWSNLDVGSEMNDGTRQGYIAVEPNNASTYIESTYIYEFNGLTTLEPKEIVETISAFQNGVYFYNPMYTQHLLLWIHNDNFDADYCCDGDYRLKRAEIHFNNVSFPSMYRAFRDCYYLDSVYLYGTATALDIYSMFSYAPALQVFYSEPTVVIREWGYAFENCGLSVMPDINIDGNTYLDGWGLFYDGGIRYVDGLTIKNTTQFGIEGMFNNMGSLQIAKNIDVSGNASINGMFQDCYNLKEVSDLDASGTADVGYLFESSYNLSRVSNINITGATNASSMFSWNPALKEIIGPIDTSSVTNASAMFSSCYGLEALPSGLDTSNVTIANNMFSYCYNLTTIPALDTSNVINASNMFYQSFSLESLPALDLSSATLAPNLAAYCSKLEWSDVYGINASHSYFGCNLSAAALNHIYTNLPVYAPPPAIYFSAAVAYSGSYCLFTTPTPHGLTSGMYVTTLGFSNPAYNFTNAYVYFYNTTQFYLYRGYAPGLAGTLGYMQAAGGVITVTGNPGTTGDNPTIATSKGWTVTG